MSFTLAQDGAVATLTLERPPGNFIDAAFLRSIVDTLEGLPCSCRVIILAASGRAFCGGVDLAAAMAEGQPEEAVVEATSALYAQAKRLFALKLPIIAPVQGAAVGAGLGLAAAAEHLLVDRREAWRTV